jgi:hypothetical protein
MAWVFLALAGVGFVAGVDPAIVWGGLVVSAIYFVRDDIIRAIKQRD